MTNSQPPSCAEHLTRQKLGLYGKRDAIAHDLALNANVVLHRVVPEWAHIPDGNRLRWVNNGGSLGEMVKLTDMGAVHAKLQTTAPWVLCPRLP